MSKVTLDLIYNKLVSLEGRIGGIEERIGHLEERMSSLESRMDRLESRMSSLEAGLRVLEHRMDKLEVRMDHLESGMARLESEVGFVMESQEAIKLKAAGLEVLFGDISNLVVTRDEFKTLISQNNPKYHKISK